MGQLSEALRWCNLSLKEERTPEALFEKGTIQTELHQWQPALKTFRSLEKKQHDIPELWLWMALVSVRLNDYEKAIEYGQKSLQIRPDRLETYYLLVHSSLKAQQFPLSFELATRAIGLGENSPEVHLFRAQALLSSDFEEGFSLLTTSLALFEGNLDSLSAYLFSLFETLYFAFEQKPDADLWASRCLRLTEMFEGKKVLPALSTAFTKFASSITQAVTLEREAGTTTPAKNETRAQARKALKWSRSWLAIFDSVAPNEYPSLRFAARLSAAAIQVAVSGDDRSLLDLPSEERAIVRDILAQDAPHNRENSELRAGRK
jgi:tetratricopeptide (TPR) repeat protein